MNLGSRPLFGVLMFGALATQQALAHPASGIVVDAAGQVCFVDYTRDGLCYRETGTDPRTTFVLNPVATSPCLEDTCTDVIRLRVTDDEKTYTERTTSFTTIGEARVITRSPARLP